MELAKQLLHYPELKGQTHHKRSMLSQLHKHCLLKVSYREKPKVSEEESSTSCSLL